MPMTVLVTRDVTPRFRGFLASCMLEIAPGVYTAPKMTRAVRERVWGIMRTWFAELGGGSIVLTWNASEAPGGQGLESLGSPPKLLHDADGFFLAHMPTTSSDDLGDEAL